MSLIETKKHIPENYRESEDFLAIMKLLDLTVNPIKQKQYVANVFNILTCPDDVLPLLATYVGYEYDFQLPVSDNRIIILAYPLLTRNKGNLYGIELAVKTGLKLSGSYERTKSEMPYEILIENNTISIWIDAVSYSPKLRELVEYVRPVGAKVNLSLLSKITLDAKVNVTDNPNTENWIIRRETDEEYFTDHTRMWGDSIEVEETNSTYRLFSYYFGLIENAPYSTDLQNDITIQIRTIYSLNKRLIPISWKFKSTDKGVTFTVDQDSISPQSLRENIDDSAVLDFNFDEAPSGQAFNFFDNGNVIFKIQNQIAYGSENNLSFAFLESAYLTLTMINDQGEERTFTLDMIEAVGESLQ